MYWLRRRRTTRPRVGAWVEDHNLDERYVVQPHGEVWRIMDTIPPAREVARCDNPVTAEWVRDAIDHFINGEPGSIKRQAMSWP